MRFTNLKVMDRERNWNKLLSGFEKKQLSEKSKRIWFHASSMGEFEQAKPVIELIKKNNPDINIIVTFYSPSGYNNQKNYQYADSILYMPFDSLKRAKKIVNTIKSDITVFVRYEIWRNHLWQLKRNHNPVYLICATAPSNKFLKKVPPFNLLMKSNYNIFDKIYTVSENETRHFKNMNLKTKIITSSDTRFDRIIDKVDEIRQNTILPKEMFNCNKIVFVAGSTWEPDEENIIETIKRFEKENHETIRLILVPHEPDEKHIKKLKLILPNSFLLSEVLDYLSTKPDKTEINNFLGWNHIIVDSIGNLLKLYSLADAAYIGGGFGAGVHSVTEPAGYSIPLATGPKYQNSPDAISLHKLGALTIIKNKDDLFDWLKKLISAVEIRNELGKIAFDYINKRLGSTDKIVDSLISDLNKL